MLHIAAIGAVVAIYGMVPAVGTAASNDSGNKRELGTPASGSANDTESTEKKRDPNRTQTPEQNRQITVGGAQATLEGELVSVNGEQYEIQAAPSGDRVKVMVNKDTNLDCAKAPSSGDKGKDQMSSDRDADKHQGISERQAQQGQRPDETAKGSGFKIGSCDFHQGDRVKAEVDDMGRVTTLKYLSKASH
ncbi:exported protein of unknown function [Nitrospira sp. KM1]|nr:exported protein of unknown function [Nitrospira sp. KM1]